MAGFYAADGSWNVSIVDGTTYTGLSAADGSMNCVIATGLAPVGLNHPCGARWVTRALAGVSGWNAADGSMNVSTTPYTLTYPQRVTVVSGVLP